MLPAFPELPKTDGHLRSAPMRMYLTYDFIERIANGYLTTDRNSAQYLSVAPRYGKGVPL